MPMAALAYPMTLATVGVPLTKLTEITIINRVPLGIRTESPVTIPFALPPTGIMVVNVGVIGHKVPGSAVNELLAADEETHIWAANWNVAPEPMDCVRLVLKYALILVIVISIGKIVANV